MNTRMRVWIVAVVGLATAPGCGPGGASAPPPRPSLRGTTIRVGVVAGPEGSDEAGGLRSTVLTQRGEWEADRSARVEVRDEPIDPATPPGDVDVLLFRGDRLGDLIDSGMLAPLPEAVVRAPEPSPGASPGAEGSDPLAFNDVLPAYRDRITMYGKARVALPYGGTGLVLAYRRDAFDRPENRRDAEEAGITLEPPATWDDLDALARFFHGRDWDGDGQPQAGIALALGPDPEGVGTATFLARAAALGLHPNSIALLIDADTMAPRIASPPFVEALDALVALTAFGPEGMAEFDAPAAREAFRSGTAALLIDRAERAGTWTDPSGPVAVGVAPLPGSPRVYDPDRRDWEGADPPNRPSLLPFGGGWLAGVAASTAGDRRVAAIDFLTYLCGPDTTARVLTDRAFPMLPTRASLLAAGLPDPRGAPGVDPRGWGRAVSETLTAPRVRPGLRIPEAVGYLADLDRARASAASGRSAASALEEASGAWSARTDRLGADRQLWHARSSLGRRTDTDQPPPRPTVAP